MTLPNVPDSGYRVDGSDIITAVSAEFVQFGRDNAWPDLTPELVVGRPIWDFVEGETTRRLNVELFNFARMHRRTLCVPFRCDSPDEVRRMLLWITPTSDESGSLNLAARMLRIEPHSSRISLLDRHRHGASGWITICSVCKSMEVSEYEWVDLETAVQRLGLLEGDTQRLPGVRHAVCPSCIVELRRQLEL